MIMINFIKHKKTRLISQRNFSDFLVLCCCLASYLRDSFRYYFHIDMLHGDKKLHHFIRESLRQEAKCREKIGNAYMDVASKVY